MTKCEYEVKWSGYYNPQAYISGPGVDVLHVGDDTDPEAVAEALQAAFDAGARHVSEKLIAENRVM